MKMRNIEISRFIEAAGGWLLAITALTAALPDASAAQRHENWLGWDGWVTVSLDNASGQ